MKKKCPDKIYLQACDKCYDEAIQHFEGVTWCFDNIGHEHEDDNAEDTAYVKLSRLKEAVKEIETLYKSTMKNYMSAMTESQGVHDALLRIYRHFPELKEAK